MGIFLNSRMPYAQYCEIAFDTYFADKTDLPAELIPAFGKKNRFICITRPHRFGKSVMADMVAAFFGKAENAYDLFERLAVAKYQSYTNYLNQYHLICDLPTCNKAAPDHKRKFADLV